MGKLAENIYHAIGTTQTKNNNAAAPYELPNRFRNKLENHTMTTMKTTGIKSKKKFTPLVMVMMAHTSTTPTLIRMLYFILFNCNLL